MDIDEDLRHLALIHLNEPRSPDPSSEYAKSLDRLIEACKLKGADHHVVMRQALNDVVDEPPQEEYERLLREQKENSNPVKTSRLVVPSRVRMSSVGGSLRQCRECGLVFQGKHPVDQCPLGIVANVMEQDPSSRLIRR